MVKKTTDGSELPLLVGLKQLYAAGARLVEISYSGSGDDGEMPQIRACSDPDNDESLDIPIPEELNEYLNTLADKLIPDGYQNEDGGFGTIVINLKTFRVKHTHYDYETVRKRRFNRAFEVGEEPQ